MKPHQSKFYEPSKLQLQQHKIGDIYKMLNEQDKAITTLLMKYQDKQTVADQIQKSSRTLGYQYVRNRNFSQKQRDRKMMKESPIQLPVIQSTYAKNEKKKSKQSHNMIRPKNNMKSLYENPYLAELQSQDRNKKIDHIQRSYFKSKTKGSSKNKNQVSNQLKSSSSRSAKKHTSEQLSSRQTHGDLLDNIYDKKQTLIPQRKTQSKLIQTQLPVPLGYFKQNIDEDSSSEQGEVPLTFYQREYKELIRSQCLEQTNFLYFSKNQAMKQWTQGLLLLFEKHDKQLVSLRKKCKYLQKFDENFFTIDIFKQ